MARLLSFSPEFSWTIQADPGLECCLDRIATHLKLSPYTQSTGKVIRISALRTRDPFRGPHWKVIHSSYGIVAIDTKNLGIEIGFSEKEQERPDYIAWIIKTLFVGISTLLLPSGGMLLHAATLVRDDAAVLILASSGGGKSTAAHRVPLPWIAPGDENALVIRDLSGHYQVHALSTSSAIATGGNQTWNIATPYPLQGIYILIQADDDHIIRCTQGTAAGYLNGSAQQALKNQKRGMNTEYKRWKHEMLFSVACQMAGTIPTFLLYATLTGNFWEEIEKCKVIRIGKSRLYL